MPCEVKSAKIIVGHFERHIERQRTGNRRKYRRQRRRVAAQTVRRDERRTGANIVPPTAQLGHVLKAKARDNNLGATIDSARERQQRPDGEV